METIYRKVKVSERLPEKDGNFDTDVGTIYLFKKTWQPSEFLRKAKVNEYHEDYFEEPEYWFEEIPDPTAQLQADKSELLEALERAKEMLYIPQTPSSSHTIVYDEIETLIQKMKQ